MHQMLVGAKTMGSDSKRVLKLALPLGVLAVGLALAGASVHSRAADATQMAKAPPPMQVNVETVKSRPLRLWTGFPGRMRAVDYAAIRPEVSGRITQIRFQDGQTVKAGDVLMVIDPRPYEAAEAKAEAHLASAITNANFARTDMDRASHLVASQAIAQRQYDERANNFRMMQAEVQAAQADLKQTRIDLDHAYVKAPFTGEVSRAEITLGNLVQSGPNAPVLTSIVSHNGIYADFDVDEQTYMKSVRDRAANHGSDQTIQVELSVPGDDGHVYQGALESFDNHIDPSSGTIRARARFPNQDGSLMPGMFVTAKLASSAEHNAMMVSERAIGSDQSKKFVYVVGQDGKVTYREIELGAEAEPGERVVLAGLTPGDHVIVDGLQHVRPNMVVQPKIVQD
jgi:multidrug efflux system membrane fusion protein